MSLFDNDIIYKDPQEIIWNWLENHYPGDADDLKEALEIDKDNYINVKKRWILKNIELGKKEIVPSYIKFRNNNLTKQHIRFCGCDINESNKNLLFSYFTGNAQDTTIKSYNSIILEGHFENIIVKFCAKKSWELYVDNLGELSEITVEVDRRLTGRVCSNYKYDLLKHPQDLINIQRIVKEFFKRHPGCKEIQVENDNHLYQYIEFKAHNDQIEMILHDEHI